MKFVIVPAVVSFVCWLFARDGVELLRGIIISAVIGLGMWIGHAAERRRVRGELTDALAHIRAARVRLEAERNQPGPVGASIRVAIVDIDAAVDDIDVAAAQAGRTRWQGRLWPGHPSGSKLRPPSKAPRVFVITSEVETPTHYVAVAEFKPRAFFWTVDRRMAHEMRTHDEAKETMLEAADSFPEEALRIREVPPHPPERWAITDPGHEPTCYIRINDLGVPEWTRDHQQAWTAPTDGKAEQILDKVAQYHGPQHLYVRRLNDGGLTWTEPARLEPSVWVAG